MILLFSLNGSFYVFLTELCLKLTTQRGASSSKFLNYLNKHIIPVFDKVILHFPCLEIVSCLSSLAFWRSLFNIFVFSSNLCVAYAKVILILYIYTHRHAS